MRIIVVGCGKVGQTIVEQLSREKHDISVIDTDAKVINDITNNFDVLGVVGNGASYEVLKEASIENADLLIAVTDSDELNLLCCLLARQLEGCNTIARVRNPVYSQEIRLIREQLGLSMTINPEYAAAREISRILRVPAAIKIETFAKGTVELLKVEIPEGSLLDGIRIADIRSRAKVNVLICAVEREDNVTIPNGSYVLEKKDTISVILPTDKVRDFFSEIGVEAPKVRNTMIIGGGKIAFYLAQMLKKSGIDVKIVEVDQDRCEELSESLPGAVVIQGDATDQDVLMEEGITEADAFVTLTGIDEANIFLSLFAKSVSGAKVVTKVNRLSFDNIIDRFDLGSLIYPKRITADSIVRYVRAMQNSFGSDVETMYNIIENRVEALEFVIREETPYIGIPLSELKIKDNVLIACISRMGETIQPNGQTKIMVGDSVIVVTTRTGIGSLGELIEK